jgi:hypothetical protein
MAEAPRIRIDKRNRLPDFCHPDQQSRDCKEHQTAPKDLENQRRAPKPPAKPVAA